jgi:hypothetical protein
MIARPARYWLIPRLARVVRLIADCVSWIALFGLLTWIYFLVLEEASR